MKKALLVLLAAVLLMRAAGCAADDSAPSGTIVSSPEMVAAAEPKIDLNGLDAKKIGHGQGKEVNDRNQPLDMIAMQEKYGKYDALYIFPDSNKIYLTFDEGYENGYTAKILDTLKEKNCKAVFFVTMDYVKKNPDLIRRMKDEGHVIGNHSTNHPSMPSLSVENAEKEITELHDYVRDNFGYEMTLFRPPMGEYSERLLAQVKNLGYKTMFWSFAYKDWLVDSPPEKSAAFKRITDSAHGGEICLLHAVSPTNAEILGDVIVAFREKGFEVCAYS